MADNYSEKLFLQKGLIIDVWMGSKYASIPYMTYLSKTCVSTKKMVAGTAHKKYFKKQQIKNVYTKNNKQTYLPKTAYIW